jgi:hypothetical protein
MADAADSKSVVSPTATYAPLRFLRDSQGFCVLGRSPESGHIGAAWRHYGDTAALLLARHHASYKVIEKRHGEGDDAGRGRDRWRVRSRRRSLGRAR